MSHPILGPSPTLPEVQAYIADMVRYRKLNDSDVLYEVLMLVEELGEFAKAIRHATGGKFAADTKRTELEHEAADVLMMLVGVCNILGIDLGQALRKKEELNKQRSWE